MMPNKHSDPSLEMQRKSQVDNLPNTMKKCHFFCLSISKSWCSCLVREMKGSI